ncbi:MAG TPA: sodium/proton-translocating pyrophosphatase, partial [Tepidisphaeraceae bacterium]
MMDHLRRALRQGKIKTTYLILLAFIFGTAYFFRPALGENGLTLKPAAELTNTVAPSGGQATFTYFSFLQPGSMFSKGERAALFASLLVALAALAYAGMLVRQVVGADQGTKKMQDIAAAVREGANAYLTRQLRVVGVLIAVLVFVLFFSKYLSGGNFAKEYAIGRAWAFLMGALFSATVGFVGMRMATIGNLRVAAAAPRG